MFGNWIVQDPVDSDVNFQGYSTYLTAFRYLPTEDWEDVDTSDDVRYSSGDLCHVYTYYQTG